MVFLLFLWFVFNLSFQNVLQLEVRMLSSEYVLCFAADLMGRHFKLGDIRMQECASCQFSVASGNYHFWSFSLFFHLVLHHLIFYDPLAGWLFESLSSTRLCTIVLENCCLESLSFGSTWAGITISKHRSAHEFMLQLQASWWPQWLDWGFSGSHQCNSFR